MSAFEGAEQTGNEPAQESRDHVDVPRWRIVSLVYYQWFYYTTTNTS